MTPSYFSDNRGRALWSDMLPLKRRGWYLRDTSAGPLVILSQPKKHALCIEPDGRVCVRPLAGVGGHRPDSAAPGLITDAQKAALTDLGLNPADSRHVGLPR